MIEIANLSHFIARDSGEWPKFWLPTIAEIISSLSGHSERLLRRTMLENLWDDETMDGANKTWLTPDKWEERRQASRLLQGRAKADRRDSEPLDSDHLQAAILEFVDQLQGGFLLVLRNQLPVTLMGSGCCIAAELFLTMLILRFVDFGNGCRSSA
jgi:hypothetical protein